PGTGRVYPQDEVAFLGSSPKTAGVLLSTGQPAYAISAEGVADLIYAKDREIEQLRLQVKDLHAQLNDEDTNELARLRARVKQLTRQLEAAGKKPAAPRLSRPRHLDV